MIALYTNGGARGNPGIAGAGVHIQNEASETIEDCNKALGTATNNEAEYHAVILGLSRLIARYGEALKSMPVELKLDSELVGRQLTGSYRVKNSRLRDLYNEVVRLRQSVPLLTVTTIPREENKIADKLANKAMDEANVKFKNQKSK